jgi:peptide/nickel transport system permease protein
MALDDQTNEQAAPITPAELRANRQLLTGRTAKLLSGMTSLTPSQLAWRKLRKNKLAVASLVLLILMYTAALFAQFLAPYDYQSQDIAASFRPPVHVHWTPSPIVYDQQIHFDHYHFLYYTDLRSKPHHIRFFVHGSAYRLWDIFPTDLHLFGIDSNQKVYLLGTDQFGRDYLSRLLYASQISLSVGLIGISLTMILGLLVGGISGYYGGRVDDVIMRLCEVVMSVPDFYLLLALAAALPPTLPPIFVYVLIIAMLSLIGFAGMARVIRGMVLSIREREYVEAARALGVSNIKIIVRHIIPSTYTFSIVTATLSIPGFILAEASLSFLGLGIRDPMASWGNMLSAAEDLSSLEQHTWLLVPGLLIFLTTLAFNFLGDGLRDALDPKSR